MRDNDKKDTSSSLPLTYSTIYKALSSLLPESAFVILAAIKNIIVIKEEVEGFSTMGIDRNGNLYIHSTFWEKYMSSIDFLKTVLAHELLHYVLGDVYNFKTQEDSPDYKLQNMADLIAMDSRINAFICHAYPDINPSDFFIHFYNEDVIKKDFLHKMLRPVSAMIHIQDYRSLGYYFNNNSEEEKNLHYFHTLFYSKAQCHSYATLSKLILHILKKRNKNKPTTNIVLIGSHGLDGEEFDFSSIDPSNTIIIKNDLSKKQIEKIEEAKKEIEEDINDSVDKSTEIGAIIKKAVIDDMKMSAFSKSDSNRAYTSIISLAENVTEKIDIERFKILAFNSIFSNIRRQAKKPVGTWTTSPIIPNRLAISDAIKEAFDYPTLLFKKKKIEYKIDKDLLPIYLDVSGSTNPYLPEIIKLITNVSNQIDYVWGFSTYVIKHEISDLAIGKIDTSGGTCFDCVIDHAIENKFKHIVIITDGDANTRRKIRIPEIESIVTILFGYSNKQNFFSTTYGNTHDINEVKV